MNRKITRCVGAAAFVAAQLVHAQVVLPTDQDIAKAQQRANETMQKVDTGRHTYGGTLPDVAAMPKPSSSAFDIDKIASQYQSLGKKPVDQGKRTNDLMVFVSLSIPKGSMDRIIEQAEKTGATLVFRGLRGDSMTKMAGEVQALLGERNVGVVIHPPAFQQFSVTRVPAIVLARAEAGNVLDNGCAQDNTFVKVVGDVTVEHALEHIERQSQTWAPLAAAYRRKLGGFYK